MENLICNKKLKPVALITGGAVRIGNAICNILAQSHRIALHYNSSADQAKILKAKLTKNNATVSMFQVDLTYPKAAIQLVNNVIQEFGQLNLLVNNAALLINDNAAMLALAKMKVLNMDAPKNLINAAIPHLEKTQGSIVNIADIAGILEFPNHKAYSRTKKALLKLTHEQTLLYAQKNVRINAICPGTIQFPDDYSNDQKQRIIAAIPMKKCGTPQDIAKAVAFLADSSFITGQVISIDGGRLFVDNENIQ